MSAALPGVALKRAVSRRKSIIMVIAKVWQLVRRPEGEPTVEDFLCVEEELPACSEGDSLLILEPDAPDWFSSSVSEIGSSLTVSNADDFTHVLVEAVALSIDPYMRYKARQIPLNTPMFGSQVANNTAYFGFLDICKPKAGDVVLVNGAAGAVGSAVVQIAKLKGCRVIAFAGSDEKVAWVKELGADHAFNYKTMNIGEALSKVAPKGVNIYFDNVGGKFTAQALPHMADYGVVSLCGAISTYNEEVDIGVPSLRSPFNEGTVIWKQLHIEGFLVFRWKARWMEGLKQLREWIEQGKLKYKETVFQGFEKMPSAFIGLFHGENTGKTVVVP
ncbi:prostaglandin reductase 1-like isoform X6 [Portunus trituberculatus]|uniref:prostaglandin reductase 1-like isoform X6 n=1 Tax=Portunus trituberculatus TaxID=210409 RepID=UPI001E1D154B|nr:prostaglandin reductase 1-like isoform X6 [Portunus trituberculatus]